EHILKCALDLAKAGEGVAGIVPGRKVDAIDIEEMPPVGEEVVIEAPAVFFGGVGESGFVEAAVVARIQQVQDAIFVQHQILLARLCSRVQAGAKLAGQWFNAPVNAPYILTRARTVRTIAPYGLALDEFP